jgi:multiple antibiotic resistance protein
MSFFEFLAFASGSLFIIVDPIAAIPAFMAMTESNTPQERSRMAWTACLTAAIVLMFFALAGQRILSFFQIPMPAFQVAGGFILLFVAYDMLRTQRSSLQETQEEKEEGKAKEDVAITPLAIPMLAGPGAISSVILLGNKAIIPLDKLGLCLAVLLVCFISYLILRWSSRGIYLVGPIALKVAARLMGLILFAMAVQFVFVGISSYAHEFWK